MTGVFPVEYNINAVKEQQKKNKTKQTKNNKKDPGKVRDVIYSYSSRFYAINTVPVKGKLTVLRSSILETRSSILENFYSKNLTLVVQRTVAYAI